ncbi:MAG: NFACT family protein [Gorillibacterium sp.]|nr:NFACT family protein [Gorillibacterium sp.]
MALDGLVVRAVVHELSSVIGARVGKIYQPTGSDIVLQLRSAGSAKLLLSANLTFPRVHFTDRQGLNPTEPPMFCMLLRKHCEGGVIEAVEQIEAERIIRFHIRQRDELGDVNTKIVVIEIMGRHSNIVLLDPSTGTVLDGIHHVTPALSSFRVILPGVTYVAPPDQKKANPFNLDKIDFINRMWIQEPTDTQITPSKGAHKSRASEFAPLLQAIVDEETSLLKESIPTLRPTTVREFEKAIVDSFSGLSPLVAREIVYRAGGGLSLDLAVVSLDSVWEAFAQIMEDIRMHRYYPAIKREENTGKLFFSVIPLTHVNGSEELFDSISACLDYFYGEKAERDTVKQRTSDLQRILQNEKSKNLKKLDKLQETLEDAKGADRFRVLGELLTASLHLAKKGEKKIEVVNYYDEDQRPITIDLDPLLTPIENSQRYFKKYSKAKKSLIAVGEQLVSTHNELQYLDNLLQQLSTAGLADIEEIRDELVEQQYLRDRRKKHPKKKKKDARPSITCYTSTEGIAIYVGKNNLQNEYLTNRLAQPGDTWLHTKDIPGSHVVIRSTTFSEDTLHEAAQLAAYYSQARESSTVPVDYTLIRHVRKPNGSKPGFVIYDRQKTLFATPNEALIKTLKSAQS